MASQNSYSSPSQSERVKAGSRTIMSYSEKQAYLKNSELGKVLGVSHLF